MSEDLSRVLDDDLLLLDDLEIFDTIDGRGLESWVEIPITNGSENARVEDSIEV